MYITRPLSLFKRDPSALRLPPAEGPNSGYLVVHTDQEDEEEEKATKTCCFGQCKDTRCRALPFPQDRILTLQYVESLGQTTAVHLDKTFFFPVLGQPLSSDLYYVVKADGKGKGLVHACSTEENMRPCCFCRCIKDVKPKHLNPGNVYQQMKIIDRHRCQFTASSLAPDGFPPECLRRRGWEAHSSNLPGNLKLTEANGMNTHLRSRLPDFNFPVSRKGSSIVTVGEWYCPFVFIREIGGELANVEDQMKATLFYRMSLEQQWVEIFAAERKVSETRITVNTKFRREEALLGGVEAMVDEGRKEEDGMVWMRSNKSVGGLTGIGLSAVILEKMRNEQGVREGEEAKEVGEVREFDCEKSDQWNEFRCYILLEKYVLKRADGSVVFTCSYRHPHQIKPKWEPLSLFKRDPSALGQLPPEGPHSGYLVLRDQVDELGERGTETCYFGLCEDDDVTALPFPQDKLLAVKICPESGRDENLIR
ncbi:hypothetical protein EJ110_NYTH10981 [Nymphaea thermarum]|nr:hypothetical protein EJ110_NYTH10981 [Nymphaea thermarum]